MQKPRAMRQDVVLDSERRNTWGVKASAMLTLEDVLEPGYLWNVHERIAEGDVITISHARHQFWLRLYVVKVDREIQAVFTRQIECHDWSGEGIPVADLTEAQIRYMGRVDQWCVVMGTTKLVRGLETESDAEAWLIKKGFGPVPEEGKTIPNAAKAVKAAA